MTDENTPDLPLPQETWERLARAWGLSDRQKRVTELLLRGMQDKQIAASLGLSVSTVRTHLTRTFVRLRVDDRVALVLRVFSESHRHDT